MKFTLLFTCAALALVACSPKPAVVQSGTWTATPVAHNFL